MAERVALAIAFLVAILARSSYGRALAWDVRLVYRHLRHDPRAQCPWPLAGEHCPTYQTIGRPVA